MIKKEADMTLENNPSRIIPTATGDEALAIINAHRQAVGERFEVRPLENEFPSFARELGGRALESVYLAEADNNQTGTFKWRGATVAVNMLREAGVSSLVLASAGNHSLGGTWAAREYNMYLDAFIPDAASEAKKQGPRNLWPNAMLQTHIGGATYDEALHRARDWHVSHPESAFLPAYDNLNVIAGAGTLADEILQRRPDVKAIVSASGGGGIAAGVLQRLEALGRTDIQYYAAEAVGSNSMSQSLAAGEIMDAENPNGRFKGIEVKRIGHHVFEICRRMENLHTLTVADETVDQLMEGYVQDHADLLRTEYKEPTTLVGVAAVPQVLQRHPDETIVVISTGHNAELYPKQSQPQPSRVWGGTFPK